MAKVFLANLKSDNFKPDSDIESKVSIIPLSAFDKLGKASKKIKL